MFGFGNTLGGLANKTTKLANKGVQKTSNPGFQTPSMVPNTPQPSGDVPTLGPGGWNSAYGGTPAPGYSDHKGYNPVQDARDGGGWNFPFNPAMRQPTIDPATGQLYSQFQLDVTSERPESPWLKQQLQKQDHLLSQNRESAQSGALAARDSGYNQLAATGGLSSGARERLNQTSQRDVGNAWATLGAQDSLNRLGLRTQDFTNQVQADQYNIGNTFGQIEQQAAFDQGNFDIAATAWGADRVAGGYGSDFSDSSPEAQKLVNDIKKDGPSAVDTGYRSWWKPNNWTNTNEDENRYTPWKRW